MPADDLHRPDDADLLHASLRWVHARGGNQVTFGGLVEGRGMAITRVLGGRTRMLVGLPIATGHGVGGQALQRGSPVQVDDYVNAAGISHIYDETVRAEGLTSVAAVPVVVRGQPRALLYTAARGGGALGASALDTVVHAARAAGQEMAVRDEVDRRVALIRAAGEAADASTGGTELDRRSLEAVREAHAELVALAAGSTDPETAQRLRAVARLLQPRSDTAARQPVQLSPREVDVLTQVSLGLSYADIAARLCLKPMTVKGYMRTVMQKLQAHNRTEAVVAARRLGLLP